MMTESWVWNWPLDAPVMQSEWMTFSDPPSLVEVQFKRLPWNSPFHSSRCHLGTVTTQKPYRGSFITTDIYNPFFSLLIVDGKFMKWHIFSWVLELRHCYKDEHYNVNQIDIFILCKAPFCVNQPKMERLVKMCNFRFQFRIPRIKLIHHFTFCLSKSLACF